MIKAITYEEAVKQLAAFLASKSGISPDSIFNADSARGTDLSLMISSTQSYSPRASKSFMLFELRESAEEDFATVGYTPETMMAIQSYDFHMMIYGNSSPQDAMRVFSAFKQPDNAMALRDAGVYVKGVAPIESMNEFINNTLLLRRDVIAKVQIRAQFDEVAPDVGVFDDSQAITLVVRKAPN